MRSIWSKMSNSSSPTTTSLPVLQREDDSYWRRDRKLLAILAIINYYFLSLSINYYFLSLSINYYFLGCRTAESGPGLRHFQVLLQRRVGTNTSKVMLRWSSSNRTRTSLAITMGDLIKALSSAWTVRSSTCATTTTGSRVSSLEAILIEPRSTHPALETKGTLWRWICAAERWEML